MRSMNNLMSFKKNEWKFFYFKTMNIIKTIYLNLCINAFPGNRGNIFEKCLTADFVKIKF